MLMPGLDLSTLIMDSRHIVFCNYFVAKPAFWRTWLQHCELIFALAEANATELARQLNCDTTYNGAGTPMKVFLIERIASLLLSTQKQWQVSAYNPLLLPMSPVNTSGYPRELLQMDALKLAYKSQGFAQYLGEFSALRQAVLQKMQLAGGKQR